MDPLPSEVALRLGGKVQKIRKDLKLSRRALSVKSGVSEATIKRFENTGSITLIGLLKLLEALERLNEFDEIIEPRDEERLRKLFED